MKKFKLLACDIDGTLLDDNGIISSKTIAAIKKISKLEVLFVISSGRPLAGIHFIDRLFDFDIPCITFNGALIIKSKSKIKIYEKCLAKEDVFKIINFANKNQTTFVVWQGENLFTNQINQKVLDYASISKVNPKVVDDYKSIIEAGIHKILFYDEPKRVKQMQDLLHYENLMQTDYYTSLPYFLEFVNHEASKSIGLIQIGKLYNIESSEMIAIGDGFNDLSMIKYAGLGIAMANAPEEIKKEANFVTLSNNNDGVLHAINTFILDKNL